MPPPIAEVQVAVVTPAAVTVTQDLPGRLEAVRTAQVRARVEGVVERRLFVEGSDVQAGKSLYSIDARSYRAALAAAEAELAVANLTVERYRSLLEDKAVSQQEFDQAAARVKQAEAALVKARLDLENANVPAPISGRIGRSMITEGALVGKGEATLLATIEQTDPIYANFTQSNSEAMRLRQAFNSGASRPSEGGQVELVLEDGSIHPHPGRLLFTDLAVDPGTGSIQMRAIFPNAGRRLLPGTFVRVRVPQAVAADTLKVPQVAVQSGAQGQFVMIVAPDGKAAVRPIKTGAMAGTDWIVTDGLSAGERVILTGLQKVRPGNSVKVVEAEELPAKTSTSAVGK
jgi:membrane fusion protein (multidrug efflux system)